MMHNGYVSSLEYLGYKVYAVDPGTKIVCDDLIRERKIDIIFTHSRYGIRQLPIDTINKNNIRVIICMLPCNINNNAIDNKYEYTPQDELQIIKSIDQYVMWTYIESYGHGSLMNLCPPGELKVVPLAGNIFKAEPNSHYTLKDVSLYDYSTDDKILSAITSHCDLLNLDYQLFGSEQLRRVSNKYHGKLSEIENAVASINATSRININLHDSKPAFLSDQTFMIPMCGGLQIINSETAKKYLGCRVHETTKDIIDAMISKEDSTEYILRQADIASRKHSYLNRLADLFAYVGLTIDGIEEKIERIATRHLWQIEASIRNRRIYESHIDVS